MGYVLIVEPDLTRAAWCLEALRPLRLGALSARQGDEAIEIVRRFGSPLLLLVDLSLPRNDAFAVMEAVRHMSDAPCGIVALSAVRDLREYVAKRTDLRIDAVVSPTMPAAEVQELIAKALPAGRREGQAPDVTPALFKEIMRDAVDEAARLAMTPGAAIYLKLSGEERFRAQVTWTSEIPESPSPFAAPRIFDWVMEAGEPIVIPDLTRQPLGLEGSSSFHEAVRGVLAVPVVTYENAIVGALCAFDVKPLVIGTRELEAIQALGRWVGTFLAVTPARR